MTIRTWSPIQFHGTSGKAPFVLLCEHAAKDIPQELGNLGLDPEARASHAAWDIGALDVATGLSQLLDAPLVAGGVSRLVYDCNRPLQAPDCMPVKSEVFSIPGNKDLTDDERQLRFALVHEPFHSAAQDLIRAQIKRSKTPVTVLTIHSFTPVYNGGQRLVELGFLFDKNSGFSDAIQTIEQERGRFKSALNEPYDATDGVTYSLRKHAEDLDLDATMIEIRNDLINTQDKAKEMADHLAQSILQAHETLHQDRQRKANAS
ncbi:N-formylglutamate amidohydrolase [Cohaesibacter celericrescens]|uniref:N-formylglutamate amidohydrolase n=1 Tax=Cohaesibacter celericrescens TaxID=2067669 RepID=A0A2N5XMJ5_9HYPH|nr:N-formylglutamate amidohydrolase [Cohaesibacter celericrescens]PLW75702.1 N-formylglutamate amidohydrolase [Cohaesibacter celericrescens]